MTFLDPRGIGILVFSVENSPGQAQGDLSEPM